MAIKHTFQSVIADDPVAEAAGEVTPTRWNDDHIVEDGSLTIAATTGLQDALNASRAFTTVEKNLGAVPKSGGKFTITGFSGLTIGKVVNIFKAVGPYTNKGTRADEAEMDAITVSASVTAADTITAYWNSATRVKGNYKFNYLIGA